MEQELHQIWIKICQKHTPDLFLADKIWTEIAKAYQSKGRYYHTLEHISMILNSLVEYQSDLDDLETIQFAAFFHDVVYSAKRKDNEEKSAEYAARHLKSLNFPIDKIETCSFYILATKSHHNPSLDKDLDYFLDADLEKLGAPWDKYLEYTQQIRKEYRIYPDLLYIPGRRKVLEHFLKSDKIYKTKAFIDKYEKTARTNLARELEMLRP